MPCIGERGAPDLVSRALPARPRPRPDTPALISSRARAPPRSPRRVRTYSYVPTRGETDRPQRPHTHTSLAPFLGAAATVPRHPRPGLGKVATATASVRLAGWVQCLRGWDPLGCVSFEPRAVRSLVQALGCRPRQVFGFSLARAASSSESDPVGAHNLVPGDIDPPRRMRFRGDVLVAARARWRRTKVQTARKLA